MAPQIIFSQNTSGQAAATAATTMVEADVVVALPELEDLAGVADAPTSLVFKSRLRLVTGPYRDDTGKSYQAMVESG